MMTYRKELLKAWSCVILANGLFCSLEWEDWVFSILTFVGAPERRLFFKRIPPTHTKYMEDD
jgi:hypothetical protein